MTLGERSRRTPMTEARLTRRRLIAAVGSLASGCSAPAVVSRGNGLTAPSSLPVASGPPAPRLTLPDRPADALDGAKFCDVCTHLRAGPREIAITTELLRGNVPGFLRKLVFVPLEDDRSDEARPTGVFVTSDYLAIGDDDDFVRLPVVRRTAVNVGRAAGCVLPTSKIVDAIYRAATCKVTSPSHGAGPHMASTELYVSHSREIDERRGAAGCALGALTAGPKKDLVMSAREREEPGRLAIYGWFTAAGAVIQPLSLRHSEEYVDFSHGVRLVHANMLVRGEKRSVIDVLASKDLAHLVSDEGAFTPLETL
jgi:hypothetical protein